MKSKTKTESLYKPEINAASSALSGAYNQAAPNIQKNADAISGLVPGLLDQYKAGDPSLTAAQGYNTDVLSGKYLDAGNPYLQDMIDRTNNSVRNQAQASFGSRGQTNGSDYYLGLADRLAANETGLRYQDYGQERDRMGQASAQVPGLIAADNARLDPILSAANASLVPLQAASGYAGGVGGLLGNYTKTTQKGSLGQMLAGLGGTALSAWAGGGFK